jgi:hypothetical protein
MDAFLQRVIEAREREQRERDMENLKRPKCEKCGALLAGSRSHKPLGERICAACEVKT